VHVAETPEPQRYGVGYRPSSQAGTLFPIPPAHRRQLRGSREVVGSGTGARLSHVAWTQDANMPAGGKEDRGCGGAACQGGTLWTGCRPARDGRPEQGATFVAVLQGDGSVASALDTAP
jgi:hypothetical protein